MLRLLGGHGDMLLASGSRFPRRRTSGYSARAAVKTDPLDGCVVVDDGRVVGVAHDRDVYVGHGAVVIVGATSPVARVPNVEAVFPSPIPWSPEQADLRREYPCSRDPEMAVRTVSPVARDPNVARFRTNRLYVHGQHRRTNPNGDAHSNLRSGLNRYRQ